MTRSLFSAQYDRLCRLLIQARVDAGMSQAALAKCLNRPQSYVSKYETKQRRLDVVEFLEIAHCMGASGPEMLRRLAHGPETQAASLMLERSGINPEDMAEQQSAASQGEPLVSLAEANVPKPSGGRNRKTKSPAVRKP